MDPVTLFLGGVALYIIWKKTHKKSSSDITLEDPDAQPLPEEFSMIMEQTEIAYGIFTAMMKEID